MYFYTIYLSYFGPDQAPVHPTFAGCDPTLHEQCVSGSGPAGYDPFSPISHGGYGLVGSAWSKRYPPGQAGLMHEVAAPSPPVERDALISLLMDVSRCVCDCFASDGFD